MITSRILSTAVLASGLWLAAPVGGRAEEPIVKHEPTPAPSSGPTLAAAEGFCGEPTAKADELAKRYMGQEGLQKIDDGSKQYLTYTDDPKNASVMYNFSTEDNPAHPVAVCRKLVREGEQITLKYNVVCGGSEDACAKATSDFNVLIARMQAQVNQQVGGQGAGK